MGTANPGPARGRMTVRVEVSAKDIAEGRVNSKRFCPVARAATRALAPYGLDVSVGWLNVRAHRAGDNRVFVLPLPTEAEFFVEDFERGRLVRPFAFELELPAEVAA